MFHPILSFTLLDLPHLVGTCLTCCESFLLDFETVIRFLVVAQSSTNENEKDGLEQIWAFDGNN